MPKDVCLSRQSRLSCNCTHQFERKLLDFNLQLACALVLSELCVPKVTEMTGMAMLGVMVVEVNVTVQITAVSLLLRHHGNQTFSPAAVRTHKGIARVRRGQRRYTRWEKQ